MATLRELRNRIKGVKNTQQITKAMKMVAAAKLRRAQENILNARPYARKISEMTENLITDKDRAQNNLLQQKNVKSELVVVVTADRGLCGAFNTNIIKEATAYVNRLKEEGKSAKLFCIGKKGYEHFSKRDFNVVSHRSNILASLNHTFTQKVAEEVIAGFNAGDYEKVVVIYNEFKSVIQQKIVNEQYLPVTVKSVEKKETEDAFIFEPSQAEIFNYLLPRHLEAQLWRVMLESIASELGAKMTAMDNATTNARDLIKSLNTTFNKARQAMITNEILEVVSGANALKVG